MFEKKMANLLLRLKGQPHKKLSKNKNDKWSFAQTLYEPQGWKLVGTIDQHKNDKWNFAQTPYEPQGWKLVGTIDQLCTR